MENSYTKYQEYLEKDKENGVIDPYFYTTPDNVTYFYKTKHKIIDL